MTTFLSQQSWLSGRAQNSQAVFQAEFPPQAALIAKKAD